MHHRSLFASFLALAFGLVLVACGGKAASPAGENPCAAQSNPCKVAAPAKPADITVEQLAAQRASYPLVLDVRTPEEYSSGHVPGAINLPLQELEGRMAELQAYKDKDFAVICRSGKRSATARDLLVGAGYNGAHSVTGGTLAWIEGGRPVVEGDAPGGRPVVQTPAQEQAPAPSGEGMDHEGGDEGMDHEGGDGE